MIRIGILTGGGDCPGLNAVIRAVSRRLLGEGVRVLGIRDGWKGLIERDVFPLTRGEVSGILHLGGTILGTSRTNPFRREGIVDHLHNVWRGLGLSGLVAIGGEDTLGVAARMVEHGFNLVGVPKTIDNDLAGTQQTFGFDTAVGIATEAIDRLHSTAESHRRVMVVEVMGRHAGWIALYAGIAGGADFFLIPEAPTPIEDICEGIRTRFETGRRFAIVVVSEGARLVSREKGTDVLVEDDSLSDEFGHKQLGGLSHLVGSEIKKRTGVDTRVTILGHVQRGGSPSAFDRVLATRYGIKAAELVLAGDWGKMTSLEGQSIGAVELSQAVGRIRSVDPELLRLLDVFRK